MSGSTVAPATVAFTNRSTNADSYRWDFGDGRTSTLESPQMTFNSTGTFTIKLVATRISTSKRDSSQQQLTITYPPPVARFAMTGATVTPASITFNNQSENADEYEWDFGDGRTSVQQNPVVTFNNYGVYEVSLIASRSITGISDTTSQSLTISPGRVFIESIRVEQIPFVDQSGAGWDLSSGPDVFWSLDNAAGTEIAVSPTYFIDVAPANLPLTFDVSPDIACLMQALNM